MILGGARNSILKRMPLSGPLYEKTFLTPGMMVTTGISEYLTKNRKFRMIFLPTVHNLTITSFHINLVFYKESKESEKGLKMRW